MPFRTQVSVKAAAIAALGRHESLLVQRNELMERVDKIESDRARIESNASLAKQRAQALSARREVVHKELQCSQTLLRELEKQIGGCHRLISDAMVPGAMRQSPAEN